MLVNGEKVNLEKSTPLSKFLEGGGYPSDKIAVELNGVIISRSQYSSVILTDADKLEIVCFVGGG